MITVQVHAVIHFENCADGYSVPLKQKLIGHNSNTLGQKCIKPVYSFTGKLR
jgi:hypothetical protein